MSKTILKTALITIGGLVVALGIIFTVWIFAFPGSMATVSVQWGNYNFAVKCANRQYNRTGKTEDLAVCAEISIFAGDDALIVKYCEPLVEKDDFDSLCIKKDEEVAKKLEGTQFGSYTTGYSAYVIGNLAVSQYRTGSLEKAVATAEGGDKECFKKLIIEVVLHGTEEDKQNLKEYPKLPETRAYVEEMINLLTNS